ncbi:hypothetical protein CE195_07205 [Sodalis-like symbiont of Philaenus spumarius]|nr:hypothetical protein CE195_07205 [Sodalis-like symbiont of Philaenus spumarius]
MFAELAGDADFEAVFIDSTIVRVHQHATGSPRLARKTICFSRSVEIHEKVIGAFIEKHIFY